MKNDLIDFGKPCKVLGKTKNVFITTPSDKCCLFAI